MYNPRHHHRGGPMDAMFRDRPPFGPEGIDPRIEARMDRRFGPRGFGPHGRRAPKGALRETILKLLADQPLNGYQIMAAVAEKTAEQWRPSPGAVYPCLSQLEDEGLIKAVDADGQKLYALTEEGAAAAQAVIDEPWMAGRHHDSGRRGLFEQLQALGLTLRLAAQTGTPDQIAKATAELESARQRILGILAESPSDKA